MYHFHLLWIKYWLAVSSRSIRVTTLANKQTRHHLEQAKIALAKSRTN